MAWQQNLLSNLLAVMILIFIFLIIYCRVKGTTLIEIFKEAKGAIDE